MGQYSVDTHACVSRGQSVVSVTTLLSVLPLIFISKNPFLRPSGSATHPHPLLSLSLSHACLASSSSSRCRDVNFTADIFFYSGPRAQRLSLSHLPRHVQSKWLSFVRKISLHFKNPLKLSKI